MGLIIDKIPFGVVPILPTFFSLLMLLPLLGLLVLTALFSFRDPVRRRTALRFLWRQKYALLLMITCGAALAATVRALTLPPSPPRIPSRRLADLELWPMARGSLLRTGLASPQDAIDQRSTTAAKAWQHLRRNETFYASPAITRDHVYAVAAQGDQGRIYCFDRASGQVVWSARPDRYRATFSSPVVYGQRLLCGEGLHHVRRGRLVCLDLRPGNEGNLLWSFAVNSHIECTPLVSEDRVYFGAGDDGVYCLALGPSIDSPPSLAWHVSGTKLPDAETSLAVHDGRVYVGLGIGGSALCVLDASTGKLIKRIKTPYPVFSPPSIVGNRLFVGMGQGDYVTPDRDLEGRLSCFDLTSLKPLWHVQLPGTVLGCVAIDVPQHRTRPTRSAVEPATDHRLVLATTSGEVQLRDFRGQLLEQFHAGSPIVASPAVDEQRMYVVTQNGDLFGLAKDSLDVQWHHVFERAGYYMSSPVSDGGSIYVGTDHDGLQRLVVPSAQRNDRWVRVDTAHHFRSETLPLSIRDQLLRPVTRDQQFEADSTSQPPSAAWKHRAAGEPRADGQAIVTIENHNSIVMRSGDGQLQWTRSCGQIDLAPIFNASMLIVACQQPAALSVIDLSSGVEIWKQRLSKPPTAGPLVIDHQILLGFASGIERFALTSGSKIPSSARGPKRIEHLMLAGAGLVAQTADDELFVLNRNTLQTIWQIDACSSKCKVLIGSDGLLFASYNPFASHDCVYRLDFRDGSTREAARPADAHSASIMSLARDSDRLWVRLVDGHTLTCRFADQP